MEGKNAIEGTDEIGYWIMRWRSHALVLEPEFLRDEIRKEAEGLLNRNEKEGEKEEEMGYQTPR